METTTSSSSKQNNLIWWAGGAFLVLCMGFVFFTLVIGFFVLRSWDSAGLTTNTSRAIERRIAQQTIATPVPVVLPMTVIATPEGGDYETAILQKIYREVNPSVVNVTVLGTRETLEFGDFLPGDEDDLYSFSSGSGFVWDEAGHIVTNNHVVESADEVQITFSDGAVAIATVVGTDVDSDLAVLKINPDGYTLLPIRQGSLDNVQVGMRVAAIGNPFGLAGTLTSGIVSALGRSIPARQSFSIPDSIQTDAAINPGNSGGPLLDEFGELIGVNAQIRSETRSNSGVGFAIPISIVKRVIPAIIENGAYIHSYIGISGGTYSPLCADDLGLPKTLRGAVVIQVLSRTPAARAGLRGGNSVGNSPSNTDYPDICPTQIGGDIITAVDGTSITRFDDLLVYLQRYASPGDTITLSVLRSTNRDLEELEIDVTLAARPRR
ncbi:MAG: trypsin-like peptidase domain-containing protein [Chloroflexota bacterium]